VDVHPVQLIRLEGGEHVREQAESLPCVVEPVGEVVDRGDLAQFLLERPA